MKSARLWRPIVIAVVGLTLVTVIPTLDWGWTLVWRPQADFGGWRLQNQHPLFEAATSAAAVALVLLAAVEIRGIMGADRDKKATDSVESNA